MSFFATLGSYGEIGIFTNSHAPNQIRHNKIISINNKHPIEYSVESRVVSLCIKTPIAHQKSVWNISPRHCEYCSYH